MTKKKRVTLDLTEAEMKILAEVLREGYTLNTPIPVWKLEVKILRAMLMAEDLWPDER